MAQRSLDRRAEETEEQNNSRLSVMAQRGQDRKVEEIEEKINSRLSDMAQRGHERRAEETEGQRNSRLSAMVQHARERRLNVIEGQNHHQIQTFYVARTVLYSLFISEIMLGMCLITSLLLSARKRRIIRDSPCNAGPRM
ncbi:hypothetical protein AVEN_226782-1 [Araneus ventricosus]|uniref:STPR domain-containing protein n=1 Tax=Araneus ventricosus TaxID=182803 RepID=A0A4Y1ZKN1_ARAVE|nr:hypothetical protein AVEN_226780-1 [Araneus ventricosus]GBL55075.1 hypothetical protein AVEN_226782-1 [Araneus ventricosus]